MDSVYYCNNSGFYFYNYNVCITAVIRGTIHDILNWQDFLDYISTAEGLIIGIVSQVIPVICVTIGAIFLLIFVIKLARGKE